MLIIRWRRFSSLIFLSRQSINIESTVINGCIDHRWSTMIIIFPPFFPPPPADDFMAEWQRQRLIFFDCGVTFDHHRSAMIKNYLRWSWINNDDDNLLMFIFGCLIVNAYDWSTLFYLSSNPWISAVPVSQLISMGTSLFTTLHTLGNFCWPKIISLSIDLTYGQILTRLNIFGYDYY